MKDRILLSLKRWRQYPGECALAATASLANYYEPTVDYENVRSMVRQVEKRGGLYTSQQGRLLNKLGFYSVTIVTADLSLVDFSWQNLSKKSLIRKMKQLRAHYKRTDNPNMKYVADMIQWLEDKNYDNKLVIDFDFAKYIKRSIRCNRPVGTALRWTSLFRFSKRAAKGINGDITGESELHAVVVRGYDEEGVFIVDSHHEDYRGKRKKYKRGFYKLPWAKFLVNIPEGDLLWVD